MNLDDLIVGKALAVSVMASKETKVIVRYGPTYTKTFPGRQDSPCNLFLLV